MSLVISNSSSCADGCESCPIASAATPVEQAPYSGRTLGLVAMFYFMVPIVLAIAGAAAFGSTNDGTALGGFGGLVAGIIICTAVARRVSLRRLEQQRVAWEAARQRRRAIQSCEEKAK
jgi:hypothetical protein